MREDRIAFEPLFRRTIAPFVGGLCAAIISGLLLVISSNPWASMLVGAAICAAVIGYYLITRPLRALYLAVFLTLMPMGLRFDPLYTIISNLALLFALVAWGIQWLLRRERIHWEMTWLLLAAYILLGIITLLWAPDLIEGRIKTVAYILGFILFFLIIQQVRTLRSVDGLMSAMRGIGWIIVTGGLFEIVFGSYQSGERLTVYDINQNQLVMIMIMLLPSFIWPVLRSSGKSRWLKLMSSIIYILCTFIFSALSGSRGGALSMVLLMMGFLLSRQVRPWALLGALLIGGVIVAAPSVLDTITQRFEDPEGGSFGGRDLLWEAGLLLIQDHPWSGVGLGGGPLELPKYVAVLTGNAFLNNKRVLQSHNPLLEVGSDTGLFGMVLYGSILASALWQAVRRKHWAETDPVLRFYQPFILIVAAAYFLSWIKSGGVENHPTFFILLALLMIPALVADRTSQDRLR